MKHLGVVMKDDVDTIVSEIDHDRDVGEFR